TPYSQSVSLREGTRFYPDRWHWRLGRRVRINLELIEESSSRYRPGVCRHSTSGAGFAKHVGKPARENDADASVGDPRPHTRRAKPCVRPHAKLRRAFG